MADNVTENAIMKSVVQYCVGGGRPGKTGKACLTAESFCIRKVSQTIQTVCMIVGVALALVVVNAAFGLTGGSYMGAALKGCLTGMAGAIIGIFAAKLFPQKAGEVDINIARNDIVNVSDKSIGVRRALEIHSKNGIACVIIGLAKQEEWKSALLKK